MQLLPVATAEVIWRIRSASVAYYLYLLKGFRQSMTLDNYHQERLIGDNGYLPRQNIDFEID